MQELTFSFTELHVGLFELLVVALYGSAIDLMRVVMALSVLDHGVLRLVEFTPALIAVLQDLEVRPAHRLSVNVLFSYLRP